MRRCHVQVITSLFFSFLKSDVKVSVAQIYFPSSNTITNLAPAVGWLDGLKDFNFFKFQNTNQGLHRLNKESRTGHGVFYSLHE